MNNRTSYAEATNLKSETEKQEQVVSKTKKEKKREKYLAHKKEKETLIQEKTAELAQLADAVIESNQAEEKKLKEKAKSQAGWFNWLWQSAPPAPKPRVVKAKKVKDAIVKTSAEINVTSAAVEETKIETKIEPVVEAQKEAIEIKNDTAVKDTKPEAEKITSQQIGWGSYAKSFIWSSTPPTNTAPTTEVTEELRVTLKQ